MPKVTKLQRGANSWRLRIETKDAAGRRVFVTETVRGTEEQAEARRLELEGARAPSAPAQAPARGVTLDQAFTLYVAERRSLQALSDSSAQQYDCVRRLYLGALASVAVDRITQAAITEHFKTLGGRLNGRTMQNVRRKISTVMTHQIDMAGLGIENPVRKVKLGKVPATAGQVLAPHELDRVLEACRGQPIGLLIRFGLATGLRRGEICGLLWGDIDLRRGVVHVRSQVHLEEDAAGDMQWVRSEDLKTEGSRRAVGIPASLVADLIGARAEAQVWATKSGKPVEGLFVFLNGIGRAYTPSALSEAVRRFFLRLQLPCTVHDLRHIHATMLLKSRHSPKAVARRLGHSRVETTLSIYAHALPDDDASLTAEAGAIIDGGI